MQIAIHATDRRFVIEAAVFVLEMALLLFPLEKLLFKLEAFDVALLADLPASCDPCGENGEFHTCVHDSPLFAAPIAMARAERVLRDGRFQYIDLIESDR